MPDLNSVPPSPRPLAASRRQSSQNMPPPPVPSSPSLNILPSNQNAVNPSTSSQGASSPQATATQPAQAQPSTSTTRDATVESGPGPLRHPRPLTASELHIELEKEQEAVVNRLTRELSLLRAAQNASVVSNTSSTSATTSNHEPPSEPSLLSGSGFTIPTSRRHRRSSSTTSQTLANQLSNSYEARGHVSRPSQPTLMSRQSSSASRRSRTGSPAPQSSLDPSTYFQQQRIPPPSSVPMGSVVTPMTASSDQMSPGMMPATVRYEETQFYRNELETAKKENETLKRRIRELEKQVQERRASRDASRTRSESVSTTASMSVAPSGGASTIAGPRASSRSERGRGGTRQSVTSVGVGVPEDEVQVGESAASSGLDNNTQS